MSIESRTVRNHVKTAQCSFMLCIVVIGLIQSASGQLRDSYKAAAEGYLKAAQMTACEDRRSALMLHYEWNMCWVRNLENGTSYNCPAAPSVPDCPGDKVGATGSSGSMNSSPATAAPPTSGIDYSSQNAEKAFRDAISAGQGPSGAMVQATLAGAAPIVDPNEAMIYSAIGLGLSGLLAFKEKAAARDVETEVRINNFMRNYETSRSAFSFLQGKTSYTVADLLLSRSKKGRIISLTKSVRHRIERNIVETENFNDTLIITELIRYISSSGSIDSMYVVSVTIPILMTELQIYSGNYTNSYNQETNSYNSFRYRTFDSLEIQGNVMNGMGIPSGLIDCILTCKSSCIQRRSLRVLEENVESALKHIILIPASYCETHLFSFSNENNVAHNLDEYFSQVKLIH